MAGRNNFFAWHSSRQVNRTRALHASPPVILTTGFLALIFVGTVLLSLPLSGPQPIGVFNAFFMATSAVTVTGLASVNPATDLSYFGQIVLVTLVQLGGLGFVTFAVLTSLALGKNSACDNRRWRSKPSTRPAYPASGALPNRSSKYPLRSSSLLPPS